MELFNGMNDDPLIIIKQEIAEKKKESESKIAILKEKEANLKNQIADFQNSQSRNLKNQKIQHENNIKDLKEKFQNQQKEIQRQFTIFTEKRNNQLVANSLLENSNFEQQIQEIQKEINAINSQTEKYIDDKIQLYQSLLLPFKDSIEFDKMRIEEIQKEINAMNDSKLIFNKVDKYRKGPKITPLDSKINEIQNEMDDIEFSYKSKSEKLEKSYERKRVLAEYEITKLKQSIKEAKQRQSLFLSRIEEEKSIHKIKMTSLKMKLLDLTDPKPFPAPKKKINRSKKIQKSTEETNEISEILENRNNVLCKLKEKQSDFLRKIRKLNWILSNPTDFTYSRTSSRRPGIES